ncbi:hypothetical protein GGX14DRAFT_677105 [Mycena pura]|uniref:Uncharacterized protein n=1 Tax=Mycena pura TaxID=153505 RepID=A0AAD6UVC6_9AGAR|nr:hypothetical protein GGX14DRAFT_677105 [Mycena pura]
MLLRCLLVSLLIHKGIADQIHHPAPADSCEDVNNRRRLFDIVWGCLTTIFACTWISVHPNVPPPKQSSLALLWRRLKLMIIAVIAPELMVGFAAEQFFFATRISREFQISLTHGFFFSMGGFVTDGIFVCGDGSVRRTGGHPIVTKSQLNTHISAVREVTVEAILDKSKGDALSKGVAFAQGLWFIAQFGARVAQRLPVTELEVSTLAFAVLNLFMWLLWWKKPLDVQDAVRVGATEKTLQTLPQAPQRRLYRVFADMLDGLHVDYNPITSNSVPPFWVVSLHDNQTDAKLYSHVHDYVAVIAATVFGAIHCAVWKANFPSPEEQWMWRSCALLVTILPLTMRLIRELWWRLILVRVPRLETLPWTVLRLSCTTACVAVLPSLYVIARIFLLTIPFTTLRSLSAGIFVDVDWSVYIPHL